MVSLKFTALAAAQVLSTLALNVKVQSSGGNATSGHQYGFLFEDINNSGDGGIYAELIRNRAFQYSELYPVNLSGWRPINSQLTLQNLSTPLSSALPVSMNVAASKTSKDNHGSSSSQEIGFLNEGYWGMDVKKQTYTGSFWVKGSYKGSFTASLRSNFTNEVFGSVEVPSKATSEEWTEHEFTLVPHTDAPSSNNTFAVTFDPSGAKDGSLDFNLISLFPPTYKNRKNGLRIDIAETLASYSTRFRLPGGNMLEGNTNKTRWDWKKSIGPLKDRPGYPGVWGYQQTNGLGLMEFMYWAEDMNLSPIVAVWDGLALDGDITPEDELQPFIDDALDELEFLTGPSSSKWGAVRASLGRTEPFPLEYVEVGNEDFLAGGPAGFSSYLTYRFPLFYKAIKAKFPHLTVISSCSRSVGQNSVPKGVYMDYHPYLTPDQMINEFYNITGLDYQHMVGEFASITPNGGGGFDAGLMPFPWWIGSVGEAVALIGYEHYSADIPSALFAPVLRNMNRWQWSVTIVQFAADPKLTTRSTSWHIWNLLAAHPMTHTLPATEQYNPIFYVAGINAEKGSHIWKGAAYNTTNGADVPVSVSFDGVKAGTKAAVTVLTSKDPYGYNDPHKQNNVVDYKTLSVESDDKGAFHFSMPNLSVAVLETDCGNGKRGAEVGSVPQPFHA